MTGDPNALKLVLAAFYALAVITIIIVVILLYLAIHARHHSSRP